MALTDDPRRQLPGVDVLLAHPSVAELTAAIAPEYLAAIARERVAAARETVAAGGSAPTSDQLAAAVVHEARTLLRPLPHRVINATGVILHTGLGRAPLGAEAARAVQDAAGYCNVELDLAGGERGDRQLHVEALLRRLTGAEAALVVNNNAAALYLVLNALAYRREVVVSRGQLIEIGGSFRLPDIMARSGVRLVEVGTTNRTRLEDYRTAVSSHTALLLSAHPSNYRISGFTETVTIADLATLGRAQGIPVVDDVGNGLLGDWTALGFPPEPNVAASLEAGASLVLVSGDKALGGPQAGIIVGQADLVGRLKKNPLARVLRPDKLSLAALNATLRCYLDRSSVARRVPFWGMLLASTDELKARAERLRHGLESLHEWRTLEVRASEAEAGSGTLPAVALPSVALCTLPRGLSASAWAKRLRSAPVPVVGVVRQDLLWLDMRTLMDVDEEPLVATVSAVLNGR